MYPVPACFQVEAAAQVAGRHGSHHYQPVPAAGNSDLWAFTLSQKGQDTASCSFCCSTSTISLGESVQWVFFVGVPLLQIYEAIDNHEGSFCAELLSFKHPHVANPRLQVRLRPRR